MSAFNEPVVYKFFLNKYLEVVTKHNIRSSHVWNTEETGVPTVMPPCLRYKGVKQVKKRFRLSAELTQPWLPLFFMPVLFPPVYIFLRKNFLPSMSRHGPSGCLCLAHPSIWIYGDTFFTAAFQKNVWTVPSTIPSIFYLTTTTAIWTTKLSVLLRKMEFTCLLSLHIVPTDFNYWISPSSALLNQL
jgi:hypothetical protein